MMESTLPIAVFDGSFAPLGRSAEHRQKPWYGDSAYFLRGWLDRDIWKSACLELIATCGLVFTSGQIGATLASYGTTQLGAYIGICNIILLTTFIYATAPASGGHVNQMITFSSILAGLCPLPRGVLYMVAQTIGSALAGGLLAGVWGYERSVSIQGGGCFFNPATVSPGQVFLNEVASSFTLLFLAYGVGLDPRQAVLFGPRVGPLLVGTALGLVSFASSGMIPGYSGAQMHPGRCFGLGIARRDLSYQWIWWFGPAAAGIIIAVVYNLVPPGHLETSSSQEPSEQAREENKKN